jgi:hypothetical protein
VEKCGTPRQATDKMEEKNSENRRDLRNPRKELMEMDFS